MCAQSHSASTSRRPIHPYLKLWNEVLADVGWTGPLPLRSNDDTAMLFCDLRAEYSVLERLITPLPHGQSVWQRLRSVLVGVQGDPPTRSRHLRLMGSAAPLVEEELQERAELAVRAIRHHTGRAYPSAVSRVFTTEAQYESAGGLGVWWPIILDLEDPVSDAVEDLEAANRDAFYLLHEPLYQLRAADSLAHHVLWPFVETAFSAGPEPYQLHMELELLGVESIAMRGTEELALVMQSTHG